jgi:predicted dehydrogenase
MIERFLSQNGSGSASEPVRLGVVGVGYWGPNLVRNIQELEDAEVRWVCDLRQEALDTIARRYPSVTTTTTLTEVLEDESVDAVMIATPVSTHYSLALAALESGKHVMVEKPLAESSASAEALIAFAEASRLVLMPGHTFVYSPAVTLIRNLITSGDLGEIYFISTSRVNLGLHQADVSVAWDLAPHDFSILRYWLDEMPSHVMGVSRGCIVPQIADVAFVNLEFGSATIAHVELSWLAPSKLRRTTIVGSEKMVVYDDTSIEPVRVFDSGVLFEEPKTFGEYKLSYRTGDILSPRVDASEPLSLELADFCHAIRTGSPPRSNARLGLDVIRMIEATELSIRLRTRIATADASAATAELSRLGGSGRARRLTQERVTGVSASDD